MSIAPEKIHPKRNYVRAYQLSATPAGEFGDVLNEFAREGRVLLHSEPLTQVRCDDKNNLDPVDRALIDTAQRSVNDLPNLDVAPYVFVDKEASHLRLKFELLPSDMLLNALAKIAMANRDSRPVGPASLPPLYASIIPNRAAPPNQLRAAGKRIIDFMQQHRESDAGSNPQVIEVTYSKIKDR